MSDKIFGLDFKSLNEIFYDNSAARCDIESINNNYLDFRFDFLGYSGIISIPLGSSFKEFIENFQKTIDDLKPEDCEDFEQLDNPDLESCIDDHEEYLAELRGITKDIIKELKFRVKDDLNKLEHNPKKFTDKDVQALLNTKDTYLFSEITGHIMKANYKDRLVTIVNKEQFISDLDDLEFENLEEAKVESLLNNKENDYFVYFSNDNDSSVEDVEGITEKEFLDILNNNKEQLSIFLNNEDLLEDFIECNSSIVDDNKFFKNLNLTDVKKRHR